MNLTGARQHLPALLLRSLGRALATAGGHGRHDHREVRRDIVVGFEHERDARRFWDAMRKRLEEFSLSLHPDQTRPIEFGRHAVARRAQRGLRKPERSRSWASSSSAGGRARAGSSLNGNPGLIACGRSSARSRSNYGDKCIRLFSNRGAGWRRSPGAILPTTPCRPRSRHSAASVTILHASGCVRCGAAVRRIASHGSG